MRRGELGRLLTGVAAGAVLGWLWRAAGERSRGAGGSAEAPVDEGWSERWGDRMDAAVDAAAQSIRSVSARWRERPPLDESAARAGLAAIEGTSGVRFQVLGAGIVELSGEASEGPATEAVRHLRGLPGVRAVVNRIWTPSSADPRQIDGLPGFG
ncbi:BON domain-containing protein [Gaopeijia maritima]|uniref:BON domain-containing protein n=1 Tax=Gaopeijia maritima TaxID=3119007 RepID=A0ABU9E740_9BACT